METDDKPSVTPPTVRAKPPRARKTKPVAPEVVLPTNPPDASPQSHIANLEALSKLDRATVMAAQLEQIRGDVDLNDLHMATADDLLAAPEEETVHINSLKMDVTLREMPWSATLEIDRHLIQKDDSEDVKASKAAIQRKIKIMACLVDPLLSPEQIDKLEISKGRVIEELEARIDKFIGYRRGFTPIEMLVILEKVKNGEVEPLTALGAFLEDARLFR